MRHYCLLSVVTMLVVCVICLLTMAGCKVGSVARQGGGNPTPLPPLPAPPPANAEVSEDVATGTNEFGFKLLHELGGGSGEENVFISPASISLALSMTLNGAAGDTLTAMQETLELAGMEADDINAANAALTNSLRAAEPDIVLSIANSLWSRKGIPLLSTFVGVNEQYYGAKLTELDFGKPGAADTINDWVDEQTRGKIKEIVSAPIDPMAMLFLINAIYFKGAWEDEFNEDNTEDAPFTLLRGGEKTVPMMSQFGEFLYAETEDFQAIRLPYKGYRVAMYVFLPAENSSLADLCAGLDAETWQSWIDKLADREGSIKLPRFTSEYEASLKPVLEALGMEVAFSDRADFSRLSDTPAFISEVKHKTFVEVNEKGTEAAAVTSVQMEAMAAPPQEPPFEMVVDRPFLCAIQDGETGSILFVGAIVNPEQP